MVVDAVVSPMLAFLFRTPTKLFTFKQNVLIYRLPLTSHKTQTVYPLKCVTHSPYIDTSILIYIDMVSFILCNIFMN